MTTWIENLTLLTYVQLTVVEAALLYLMWKVHRWVRSFGPFVDGLMEAMRGQVDEDETTPPQIARNLMGREDR